MGRRWWVVVAAPTTTSPSAEDPRPAAPRTAEAPAPDLSAAVARAVEAAAGVDPGSAVVDLDTGAVAGHDADTAFRSASSSKLLVAVDLPTSGEVPQAAPGARAELERRRGDERVVDAVRRMGAIDRVAAQAGLTATRARRTPRSGAMSRCRPTTWCGSAATS